MTSQKNFILCDGNEAASDISYRMSEMAVIYPITPSSPMGEYAEAWAAKGNKNIFGNVPEVNMMQSEAGAIGAVHGALQMGSLATTYTASQGLLLMIPNMYKIAGELTPFVMHVAARTIATHALSIFGDHSDVMACRQTGFAMLSSNSVQEAHDLALVSHVATLKTRVPFLHFFDGFRTSHEISRIEKIEDDVLKSMVDMQAIADKKNRALTPENPAIRGTAQNPDVFFQASEARNPFYTNVEEEVQKAMDELAKHTGRKYETVEYYGSEDAEKVIVCMGSAVDTIKEYIDYMTTQGEKIGVINVRLYRPFPVETFAAKLPKTAKKIAVLDRTKELGSIGEPLYLDVLGALMEKDIKDVNVIGGRYGLSSKEFNPACVKAVFDELDAKEPKREFTVGINDDVTNMSLPLDASFRIGGNDDVKAAVFYGLGSDGTVGANKNSIKIIAEEADKYGQAYFVYDSKKSGSFTTSHLRFSDSPIRSEYLVEKADFVACHHFPIITKWDILEKAKDGATLLINSPYKKEALWRNLPSEVQEVILEKKIKVFAINAGVVARDIGLGRRTNTIMQVCFFHLAQVIESEKAIAAIKKFIEKSYMKKGKDVVELNWKAVDAAVEHLYEVDTSAGVNGDTMADIIEDTKNTASLGTKNVVAQIMRDKGDTLPVSAFSVDGTFESATTQYEKRLIADQVPVWDPEICIQCGKCAIVCPHAAIRTKAYEAAGLEDAPEGFKSADYKTKELGENMKFTVQVSPKDCTGCTLCVDNCPAINKMKEGMKAINMTPIQDVLEQEDKAWNHFESIPYVDRKKLNPALGKHTQLMQPLFEFSGACAGCGETPYIKLVTQLFGDRMVIANATGCSSIYGGNLPTTPYAKNEDGFGPAWSNSLFEDNAEYGYGMKLAMDKYMQDARQLVVGLKDQLGTELVEGLLEDCATGDDAAIEARRDQVEQLKEKLDTLPRTEEVNQLMLIADYLTPKSMWMFGGDGWAYDIGYGGLDHVINMNRNVNILVLDTESYSNTGGQMSKSTPKGAIAKFATTGKETQKKDLGMIAMSSGNCYVAKIAMGANEAQMIKAIREAEAFDGPSIIIAYSPCVSHGFDLSNQLAQQKQAVKSGHWDMYRYNPALIEQGKNPLMIDTPMKGSEEELKGYAIKENRYRALSATSPDKFAELMSEAADDIKVKKGRLDLLKDLSYDSETEDK
ncbi:MAG: pyruvate:ferredoxin (flavodoxin) oxidoreductase [Alphaproteobacteria bacterium]|jgi:pyruvate-ferredoxin/flavodoxin oxidoreductase|nr:pyruvate:ferredoxin (flavodoxin) oxidoreductase [Alphaproteobacteria bacterium]